MKRILLSLAIVSLVSAKVHAVGNVDFKGLETGLDYLKAAGAAKSEKSCKVDVRVANVPLSVLNNRNIVEMLATGLTVARRVSKKAGQTKAETATVVAKAVAVTYLREKGVEALALLAQRAGLDLGKYIKCPTVKAGLESLISHNVRGTLDEVLTAGLEGRTPAFRLGFSYEL